MVTPQKPSHSWYRGIHWQSSLFFFFLTIHLAWVYYISLFRFMVFLGFFFFCEILTFFDQLADRSELLGELCVVAEKPSVTIHLYLNPPMAVLLVPRFFSLSHFGKGAHSLSSRFCYPLLFWHRCPRSFWVYSKQHGLFRQEIWRGNLQFMADLYCWLIFLLCTLLCWQLPHPGWWRQGQQWKHCRSAHSLRSSALCCGTQKVNPSGDGAETPNSSSISTERIIRDYFFYKSWLIFCLWRPHLVLMLAN